MGRSMRILKLRYRNGGDFLAHWDAFEQHVQGGGSPALRDRAGLLERGGIFHPTREAIPIGTPLLLEVRFPELRNRSMLQGEVCWRRPGRHSQKIRAGFGVAILASEAQKRDYVLGIARGQQQEHSGRRHRRLPIALPVSWRVPQSKGVFDSVIGDIAPGGAFVRTSLAVEAGADVVLDIRAPGAEQPLSISGRVVWSSLDRADSGFGIEFRWRDAGGARRLKELVRRIERGAAA